MSSKQAFCFVSISPVRKSNSDTSEIVTQLLFGEIVTILEVGEPWTKIAILNDGYEGFIDVKHIFYLTDKEVRRWQEALSNLHSREITIRSNNGIQRICRGSFLPEKSSQFNIGEHQFELLEKDNEKLDSIIDYAKDYLNTPYLWGGKSPFGIDCSGYTQVIFRLFNINLPRDASEQVTHGSEVDFDDINEGDLAFFENSKGAVTHVGICDGEGNIYHASGHVRKDSLKIEGIYRDDFSIITHNLTRIKRIKVMENIPFI